MISENNVLCRISMAMITVAWPVGYRGTSVLPRTTILNNSVVMPILAFKTMKIGKRKAESVVSTALQRM